MTRISKSCKIKVMNNFYKRGMATAGLVGVLSLVLLVGVGAFALYSNSRTSLSSQAANEVRDVDLGLTVNTSPLSVAWTGPQNPVSTARYVVTIRKADGTQVQGGRDRILDVNTKTADFSQLTLPNGSYYAQLRYVPVKGVVLRDRENFQLGVDRSSAGVAY